MPQREIDNPYAYRDCERWLHEQYGKKPLGHLRQAGQQRHPGALHAAAPRDLQLVPKQVREADRAVLEVYPALAKVGASLGGAARVAAPSAGLPGAGHRSHDAALCAPGWPCSMWPGAVSSLPPGAASGRLGPGRGLDLPLRPGLRAPDRGQHFRAAPCCPLSCEPSASALGTITCSKMHLICHQTRVSIDLTMPGDNSGFVSERHGRRTEGRGWLHPGGQICRRSRLLKHK